VRTSIGVKVWAMSTIYVANEVLRAWFEIANLRGLDNDYLSSNLETISRGAPDLAHNEAPSQGGSRGLRSPDRYGR